jgi:hypothetical protein
MSGPERSIKVISFDSNAKNFMVGRLNSRQVDIKKGILSYLFHNQRHCLFLKFMKKEEHFKKPLQMKMGMLQQLQK